MGKGNEKRGEFINKKPNQGVRERKKVGIHWLRLIKCSVGNEFPNA
jgi:hypothetical protein